MRMSRHVYTEKAPIVMNVLAVKSVALDDSELLMSSMQQESLIDSCCIDETSRPVGLSNLP